MAIASILLLNIAGEPPRLGLLLWCFFDCYNSTPAAITVFKRAALYKQIADTETVLIKEAKGTAKSPTPPAKKAEVKKPGRKPDVKKPKK